jgi:hypothetical protein
MTTTPHLSLPLIAAAQAQKHVTHNEALFAIDALLHCAVKDKDLAAPPAAPTEGDRYIVAASPTGGWAGKAGQVAARQDGAWRFYVPQAGWIAFVIDETQLYRFDGAAWTPGVLAITALQNLSLFGLGTTADAANQFSAKLNNALHAAKTVAEGGTGDVRVKLSKEAATRTASCLFQTGFSGRAELGLAGDDNFRVKTSANGAAWVDALVLAAGTGTAAFAAGAAFGGFVGINGPADGTGVFALNVTGRLQATGPVACITVASRIGGKQHTMYDPDGNGLQFDISGFGTAFTMKTDGTTAFGNSPIPTADNAVTLGTASKRWSQLYAGTTTINTSDAAQKTNFRPPDEAVLLAALDTDLGFYQWAEAVARKGEEGARWHFGPTAQGFANACRARGVDPQKLAAYCEDPVLAPVRRQRTVDGIEEEIETLEPTGEVRHGLRLDQFDRLLQEARWRVLNGTLAHGPPNV